MYCHLCLYLKISWENRKCFYKSITHRTISGHNILNIAVEKMINKASYDCVSKVMEWTFILSEIGWRKPVSYNHICPVIQNFITHFSGVFSRICIVSIHHNVTPCINVPEHAPDYVSFSLLMFITDYCTFFSGNFICSIYRIIIIYINRRLRQFPFHILNYFGNRFTFIVAGNQNCYFI